MFQSAVEEDGVKFLRLTCRGGGYATVALTTYAIIVGTCRKDLTIQAAKPKQQSLQDCYKNVRYVAKLLKNAGY